MVEGEGDSSPKWRTWKIWKKIIEKTKNTWLHRKYFSQHHFLVSFSGKDPLVRQLYKFDEHMEDLSQGVRPMSFSLWKYRQHITVEDLSSSFQREVLLFGGEQEYKVLDAFLKQVTYCWQRFCVKRLSMSQFLPRPVRLWRSRFLLVIVISFSV